MTVLLVGCGLPTPPADLDARTPANSPAVIAPLETLVTPQYAPDAYGFDAPGVWSTSRCSGGVLQGTSEVARYLRFWYSPTDVQDYNCRPVGGTSSMSAHGVGRAADLFFNAADPAQAERANQLVFMLLAADAAGNPQALARRMGVQTIIWNRRIWTSNQPNAGMRPYSGESPHTDHVHLELSAAGAGRYTTFFWGWNVLSCAPYACGYVRIGRYAS